MTGPLLNEDFVPAAVVGDDSTCPSSGIKYPPKVNIRPILYEECCTPDD